MTWAGLRVSAPDPTQYQAGRSGGLKAQGAVVSWLGLQFPVILVFLKKEILGVCHNFLERPS